jgi:hypothetical protein
MNKITVLFPGGFKPLTGAHLALAQRYAELSDVDQVILLIGPKDRDGITREKTIEMFDLLNSNPKIIIQPTAFNSPIMAAYEYLFALPQDAIGRYAMAASAKGDDYVRTKDFVANVDKYRTIGDKSGRTIPQGVDATELNVDVDPLTYGNGQPISATNVRTAIANKDFTEFRAAYPMQSDAEVRNAWQILTRVQESKSWINDLQQDVKRFLEGYMDPKTAAKHQHKISKLKKFLDNNFGKPFTYDFDEFEKTVLGVKLNENYFNSSNNNTESVNSVTDVLTEGGAAGHMAHPYDDYALSFGDMKEIVARALSGRLDIEDAVTEKTDGQNIQVTWKNGQPGFARNKGTVINPMTPADIVADFERKYREAVDKSGAEAAEGYKRVVEAYRACAEDLTSALTKLPADTLAKIFKNGRVFANMEIIFPATRNVISYDKAHLQFHNLVEYDEAGNVVETDLAGGGALQRIIQDANAHLQKTFSFIPPQRIRIGRISDFEDQQAAFFNEIDQLRNRYNLKDTDLVSEYHRAWWADVIRTKAQELGYEIPDDILNTLTNRWAFNDKSTNITGVKKSIENADFATWVTEFDKKDFKSYQKQNMEPFETIFLRLGAVALRNAENFLAANPSASVQQIKQEMAELIKDLQTRGDEATVKKLEHELRRIQRLGGFDAIVPSEGVVFVYGGHTYKLTGSFAPVNQILGVLKYAR